MTIRRRAELRLFPVGDERLALLGHRQLHVDLAHVVVARALTAVPAAGHPAVHVLLVSTRVAAVRRHGADRRWGVVLGVASDPAAETEEEFVDHLVDERVDAGSQFLLQSLVHGSPQWPAKS